ncbi:MAG TPA: hypothetical protein VFO25_02155 [Candidatus Eremiobacteraceae bacterium]|nr:hypothetical protein [Candidatus Eremiobacteraceae bacterium]
MALAAAGFIACLACAFGAARAVAAAPAPDPRAVDAVKRYVTALEKPDADTAYRLLTPAQQHYFGNSRNFASNYAATRYRIVSFSIAKVTMRSSAIVEVDVAQTASFYDIANEKTSTAQITEPYFALRANGTWGVKEIYVPWKSYAPSAQASGGGITVVVDRIEFFDRRIRVYCTLRDLGSKPVQVLPLSRSTMTIAGKTVAAINTADFPLNDEQFFEGARVYPMHQGVGYINFPLPSRTDTALKATIIIGPVVADGASQPAFVTIGPLDLRSW